MTHRRDIEGLRALAVGVVLLFHFGVPGTDGGFVGVDVFFVISGFLITSLLVNERESTGSISLGAFYARRARRILPISALVLAVTALCSVYWLEPTRIENLATDIAGAAFFGANIVFGGRGADYLTSNLPPSPILHYWSLAVEEQFYMLWPAFLGLVAWRARRVRARLTVAIAAVIVASLALSVLLTDRQPSWSYYGLHTRAWELAAGALLAVAFHRVESTPAPLRAVGGWVGVAGIAACTVVFGQVSTFPGWVATIPVLATLLVIAAGDGTRGSPSWILARRPLQWMGSRSYSLYLWHWPALVLATSRANGNLDVAAKLATLLGVVVGAEVGYRFLEQPVRHASRLVNDVGLSLLLGAALVASGTVSSILLWNHEPILATGATAPPPTLASTTTGVATSTTVAEAEPPVISNLSDPPLDAVVESAKIRVLPDNLRPALLSASRDKGRRYTNCYRFYDPSVGSECTFGKTNSDVVVALWGDSHAAQWESAFETIADERGWKVQMFTRGGCGYLEIVTWNFTDSQPSTFCTAWRTRVVKYLVDHDIDIVFVSQYWGYSEASPRRKIPVDKWVATHEALATTLAAEGIELVLIGDTPNPKSDVPTCLSNNRRNTNRCGTTTDERVKTLAARLRESSLAGGPGFIDVARWLCTPTLCPAVVGDILVYRDNNHLSNTFVTWLAPVISDAIAARVEYVGRSRP